MKVLRDMHIFVCVEYNGRKLQLKNRYNIILKITKRLVHVR